jgi:hypothetical protein
VANREWPLIYRMQTSRTSKIRTKWSFTSLPTWVGWINYRIISLWVKQDKQVSYFAHFLLFARLALYATMVTQRIGWKIFVERYWGEVLLL